MTKRIGPKMREALDYIASNPGCSKLAAATYVARTARYPGTSMFAFAPVNRLVRTGKVVAKQGKGNAYALYAAENRADVRTAVENMARITSVGSDLIHASLDVESEEDGARQLAELAAALPEGWKVEWTGNGNTDCDGNQSEDIVISKA